MPGRSIPEQTDETRAQQRRYVLSSTRARWPLVVAGAALLAGARLAGII